MKKNISINISGIIFHIEEDGYEKLKNYLDSINRYFSAFDDSHEIIADIEGRIAEIFLSKLKDGKQVISQDDVDTLISTMGSVKDFQAIEEETIFTEEKSAPKKEEKQTKKEEEADAGEKAYVQPRRLQRDGKRKILGGVLSGIAHYFSIDPLWIRLLFLLLFFGISALDAIGPILFLFYIAMWIILPVSYDLEEEEKLKKMFRNPDQKVLGGVCSGIAAYFGIDVVIVRLLFFVSIFFAGTGIILYIILWIILPEAMTITDKMKMSGQPVTLSNIESNIKKSLNVEGGEENIFVKILLFPFRIIAVVFDFLSKSLGPLMKFLAEALRIVIGILFVLLGIGLVVATVISLGALIGVFSLSEYVKFDDIPAYILANDINWLSGTALFFTLVIPFIFLSILGFITITKRKLISATIGWSLLGLWIISLLVLSFSLPSIITDFSKSGTHTTEQSWNIDKNKTLVLNYREAGDDFYRKAFLDIKAGGDSTVTLKSEFTSKGRSRERAVENANMVSYQVSQRDSVVTFDSNLKFLEDAKYRKQELDMTLYIPEGQKFIIDEKLSDLLGNYFRRKGYGDSEIDEFTWFFAGKELRCEGCNYEFSDSEDTENDREETRSNLSNDREYKFSDFDELEIFGDFKIDVQRSNDYFVMLNGQKSDLDKLVVEQRGDRLIIRKKGSDFISSENNIRITIEMPDISELTISGASNARVRDFNVKNVKIFVEESSIVDFDSNVESLEVETEDSSQLTLFGKGEDLGIKSYGASKVNAFDYYVDKVNTRSKGSSEVKVFATDNLKIKAEDGSRVEYRGNAKVEIERDEKADVVKK